MFGSEMLDIIISLIFVYLLLSLICSALREGIETWLKQRAVYLERGIRELLRDPITKKDWTEALYNHPLIFSLFRGDYKTESMREKKFLPVSSKLPTYIPSKNFTMALLDIVAHGPIPADSTTQQTPVQQSTLAGLRDNVAKIDNPYVKRALLSAVNSAQGSFDQALANIESWYDSTMERVSGRYKRHTQVILFVVGLILTILLNVNTITIAQALARDDTLRQMVVAQAQALAHESDPNSQNADFKQAYEQLNQLSLPIGWSNGWPGVRPGTPVAGVWDYVLVPLLGWLMTAFAISFGAPFWFDLLNKFMVIRSTVKPEEKSRPEASKDRQSSETGQDT
ncbi:MAG: hypothetical protein U1F76_08930 [Candidatus Competibacteraceae bacterium]